MDKTNVSLLIYDPDALNSNVWLTYVTWHYIKMQFNNDDYIFDMTNKRTNITISN